MSKKRAKSGTGSAQGQKWEQALLNAQLCDEEKWSCAVAMVVGSTVEDYYHANVMASVINSGVRKLFSVITREELFELVNELGNPKGKKPKEIPANSEICETVKIYLDAGEEIPLPLLAKLLKFRLLDIKQKDVKRRESERKGGGAEKSNSPVKGGKDKKAERSKSPNKGKGGKKTPEPPSPKSDSKLRKRGEEDTDNKYIDDEPDDGPQHYVVLSGFHHPHLLSHLADIGVNIDCIIKLTSQDYSQLAAVLAATQATDPPAAQDPLVVEEQQQTIERDSACLKQFWKDILLLLQSAPEGSKLHDVARLEYEVKRELVPQDPEDADLKVECGTGIFEDMACMVYDLFDAKRQWQNYLKHLQLIHVPLIAEGVPQAPHESQSQASATPAQPPGGAPLAATGLPESDTKTVRPAIEIDMRYYNELLNTVPLESMSVPLIMHAIVEQIVATEEDRDPPSETVGPPRPDGIEDSLATHIGGMALKLALSQDEHKILAEEFDSPKSQQNGHKQPKLIYHHDKMAQRLDHTQPYDSFDAMKAELQMMKQLPLSDLYHWPRPTSQLTKERAARLQELVHFCATGGLTQTEIDQAFKQFVFESMDVKITADDGTITNFKPLNEDNARPPPIPWDDPYPFFKGMMSKELEEEEKKMAAEVAAASSMMSLSSADDTASEVSPQTPEPVAVEPYKQELEPISSRGSSAGSRKSHGKKKARKNSSGRTPPQAKTSPVPGPELPQEEAASRPSSGILKSPSRQPSNTSRKSSVHFERDPDGNILPQPGDGEEVLQMAPQPDADIVDSMSEIVEAQKCNLDQWCFAEHLEPNVLLQVLTEASYNLPYMDCYYHRRDHSLMVMLHNPSNTHMYNKTTWHSALHSNVGFRNYLEHVAESISEWTLEQEAKYEAEILAKEVEKIQKEAEESASRPTSAKDKKRDRSKSPKKSNSRAGRSSSRGSSTERQTSDNPFVRQGSLKQWKEEQDRFKADEDEKEKMKSEKRARSAQKKASKDQMEKEASEKKKPGSRNSSKSRISKDVPEPAQEISGDEVKEDKKFWPFTGYDVGNNMVHIGGELTTLFPADGAQIRTEKRNVVQGTLSVTTSVLKDGHQFVIHILDPKEKEVEEEASQKEDIDSTNKEGAEKADMEKSEKDADREGDSETAKTQKPCSGRFASFTAQFKDGICVSLSAYGPEGESPDGLLYEPDSYSPPPARSPSPNAKDSPAKKGKGKDRAAATPEPAQSQVDEEEKVEEPEEASDPDQLFQDLYITCPDGLNVTYFLESKLGIRPVSEDDRRLVVRQSYPVKTSGYQDCEKARKVTHEESSRIICSDGDVIKFMVDGKIIVLSADGKVSELSNYPPPPSSRSSSPQRAGSAKSQAERETPTKKGKGRQKSAKGDHVEVPTEEEPVKKTQIITTMPSGERISTQLGVEKVEPTKDALICTASDPQTKQVIYTRDDHVITVQHPGDTTVVEHADGTRMTTYFRQVKVQLPCDDCDETGETALTEMRNVKFVHVECPGYATIKFDTESTECSTEFGDGTIMHTFPSGSHDLYYQDGTHLAVNKDGSTVVHPRPNNDLELQDNSLVMEYKFTHFADIVVETTDNEGNVFTVANNGETSVVKADGQQIEEDGREKSDGQGKGPTFKQHAPRMFILHADGSGTELLRYQDVSEYLADAEDDPATAILMDPLADHPGVLGITVLKPYHANMSQKWLTPYNEESIIPAGLTSRDLKSLPAREFKKEGPVFGTNVGQGLSIGSQVKPQSRPPVLRCPTMLELRQIIQHPPVSEQLRLRLQDGLREYAEFVKARNTASDSLLVYDPRSEQEKLQAALLAQKAAQAACLAAQQPAVDKETRKIDGGIESLYEQIVNDKIWKRFEEEQTSYVKNKGDIKGLYEKATAAPVWSPPHTPPPKRSKADWERDQREIQLEKENRRLLREHDIPPYFESELGKAFILSQAPDIEALAKELAEDRRCTSTERALYASPDSNSDRSNQITSAPPHEQHLSRSDVGDRSLSSTPHNGNSPSLNNRELLSNCTPSTMRPGAPTPAHAAGQGSPSPLRPKNPTPGHAAKTTIERPASEQVLPPGGSDSMRVGSLQMNVVGQPRCEPVRVPSYIKSGRPGASVNNKFQQVEDPVRRRVFNSSVAGATGRGASTLASMRGFELLPDSVDFGVLKEGNTYNFITHLKNTGVDACRFKIKQPPPSTGMKIVYTPGPVAAGMKADLNIEIYAIAVGVEGESGVGTISHNLEITTETDHLYLPISATVMTAYDYEQEMSHNSCRQNRGVRLVSNKPPAGQGIIRPRNQLISSGNRGMVRS